ncbi:unnamed protein product [Thlaspi arvense]|uniref:C2 domain-containing protein n=1 Tax=Thlaspi arvense TaxID=13288 RepID=A0AAU9R4M0_THLAR|nr:unnamed protein product [Thlaspi arvense]
MEDVVGLLRIRVKRGINLVSRDSLGSDPFVVITMGPHKLKTRGVENNCNPEWNDELTLAVKDPNESVNLTSSRFLRLNQWIQELSDGIEIRSVKPSRDNCLSEESKIISSNGKIVQDMILGLRNVESGEVEIQIEWTNVPGSRDL